MDNHLPPVFTVLLIEDNPTDVILLQEALAENPLTGFHLTTVDRLSLGRQWLEEHPCDVVLLDLGLPDSQGLDTVTRLAQQIPTVPIIVLSGQADEDLAIEAVQAGAQDYLVKGRTDSALLGRAIRYAIERQKAQIALQNSERRFRSLIENNTDVIALLAADGTILYQSQSVTRVLGYQPEEMVGQNAFSYLHPDDIAVSSTLFTQVLQQPGTPITGQFRYRHKDGHFIWVEAVGTNQLTEPGLQCIVSNYWDITERILAEEAVRSKHQLEEQVAKIAETAPGALFSFRRRPDGSTSMPYVSRAWEALLGWTQADVRDDASPAIHCIHPADQAYVISTIQASAQTLTPWRVEYRIIHPQRGIIWVEGHATPTLEPDGSILWYEFVTDISERKRAEESCSTQSRELENIPQCYND